MQPHQERVVTEQKDLQEKIHKLNAFIRSEMFDHIDPAEQGRLKDQYDAMQRYNSILLDRINHFPKVNENIQSRGC
jgi:hypothetical protein